MSTPGLPEFLPPWMPIPEKRAQALEAELKREVGKGHLLWQAAVEAVAQRTDCDDVLFKTDSKRGLLAVVHLTWSGKVGPLAAWPQTVFFRNWQHWLEDDMRPAHENSR